MPLGRKLHLSGAPGHDSCTKSKEEFIVAPRLMKTYFLLFPLLIFFACLFISSSVCAQKFLEKRAALALSASANAYRGDLGDGYEKWTSSFYLSYFFKHLGGTPQRRLHSSLHAGFGTLTGQAASHHNPDIITPSPSPNRFFNTRFFSVNYGLQYDFVRRGPFTAYLSQGFGIIRFNPQDQFGNDLQDDLQTRAPNESYANVAIIFPTQLGMVFSFPNEFGVGIRAGFTNPLIDYLDNIAHLGTKDGNDNILSVSFSFYAPLGKKSALKE